jgi:beta-N-acetylhexosaminidase
MKIKRYFKYLLLIAVLFMTVFDGAMLSRAIATMQRIEPTSVTDRPKGITLESEEYVESSEKSAEESTQTQDTAEDESKQRAEVLLAQMTLDEKIYQLFIVTPEQLTGYYGTVTQAGERTETALQEKPVGGIIYFASNLETPDQVTEMIENSQSYSKIGLFIAVDEEGGTVARLGNNPAMGTTSFPDMASIETTGEAYQVGYTIGTELSQLGFNLDFAPVADVNSNPDNPVIGNRSFGSDPNTVGEMVSACVSGFQGSGILSTLKHFPGHGDTETDSHLGAAVTNKKLAELEECELIPFEKGIDAGAEVVMVGHISCPEITGDNTPASLSRQIVTGILRDHLGFDGLVVTDSLQMGAITSVYSSGRAAVAAIEAGCDLLLMPEDLDGAAEGIQSAVESGELTEERIDESVLRILTVKVEKEIC